MVLQCTLDKPKWHMSHSYVCTICILEHAGVSVVLTPSHYTAHIALGCEWNESYVRALHKHSTQSTYVLFERTKHSYIHCARHYRTTSRPVSLSPSCIDGWKSELYALNTNIEIYRISCCSLTSVVGGRSQQSPWCVQKSDDELNAVCLCPGRDHHINTALIQHSVCCMLITATFVLMLSLSLSNSQLLWDMWDWEVREDRLQNADECHSAANTADGCFVHYR